LSFHFLIPVSFSFTYFLPATSSCIFGYSLQWEVSIRKLNLSSSIAIVLQTSQTIVIYYKFQVQLQLYFRYSQTAFVFFHFSISNVICISGLSRLQLSSTKFSSSIVTVIQDYSGYNCFLSFFVRFNGFFRVFIWLSTSNYSA
jgi:hypothetical protein